MIRSIYALFVFRGIIIPFMRFQEPVILYDLMILYENLAAKVCRLGRKRNSSKIAKRKYDEEFFTEMETNNIFLSSYQNNILVTGIVNGI